MTGEQEEDHPMILTEKHGGLFLTGLLFVQCAPARVWYDKNPDVAAALGKVASRLEF